MNGIPASTGTRSRRTFLAATVVATLTARAFAAEPPPPPIVHLCDLGEQTAAELGRERLVAALNAGSDAIIAATGGVLAAQGAAPGERIACAVALAEAVPFDVVNLAHRDLAGEAAALADAIARAKVQFVSASFRLPAGRDTPWKELAVVERGGLKTAFVGIAARAPSMELPGSNVVAGLQYVEPAAALAAALPRAAAAADGIVILADADPAEAAAWAASSPKVRAVIVSGRGGGAREFAPERKIFLAPTGGGAAATITFAPPGPRGTVTQLPRPDTPSAAYAQVAQRFAFAPVTPRADAAAPGSVAAVPLRALEPGKLVAAGFTGKNRAAVIEVRSLAWVDSFGPARAPEGRRFLVVDTRWRNVLTPAVVRDQQVPVAYRIPRLTDHLYLVADGRTVIRPRESTDVPGALTLEQLDLPHAGAIAEGRLIYETDARALPRHLAFRFYDFVHGFCEIHLLADGPLPEEKPVAGPGKNEVVQAAVFGVQKVAEFAGRKAPAGEAFVVVDLRARSLFVTQADATAFDPKARPGTKASVGTVADWKESRRYLQLVIDGVVGRMPEPETELDPEPRFLPDIFTGGLAVFLAPEARASLELRCDFPNAQVPGSAKILKPAGIVIPLEGTRPPAPAAKALASVKDDFFLIAVTGQTAAERFAGEDAGNDRFLVLDVTVKNGGKGGEFFQVPEQLKYAAADGSQSPPDAVTERGPRRPGALVWIPAGEQRSFQVVFRIAREERAPRLAYAGVSKAEVIELPPLRTAPAAAETGGEAVAKMPEEKGKEAATPPTQTAPGDGKTPIPPKEVTVAGGKTPPLPEDARAPKTATPPKEVTTAAPKKTPAPPKKTKDGEPELPRVRARSDLTPRGIEGVGLKAEDVNRAIDRGSAFLRQLAMDNAKRGYPAIKSEDEDLPMALALVHAGAHHKDPAIDSAIRKCIADADPVEVLGCYENGVLCMLIESYGDPAFLPKLRTAARYILEAQGREGSWGYSARIPKEVYGLVQEKPRALRVSGGRPLEPSGPPGEEMVRMTAPDVGQDGDNSSSQFSLLGLHAAARSNLRLPVDVWRRCLAIYKYRQNDENGGWGYVTDSSYGSMTCAGICALAINRFHLGEKDPADDEDIEQGLAWLSRHFSVSKNPESDDWTYYYLYSLERVGRILDTEFIGEHEWYPLGARYLVDAQQPNGSWVSTDQKKPQLDTSFALLFLTRATPRLTEEVARGGSGRLRTSVELPPGKRFYIVLDASGSMLDEIEGRQKFQVAREAVESLVKDLPEGSYVAMRVFGHRKTAIQDGASEDTALEIPMGPLNAAKFLQKLRSLRARGKTPLAMSLRESAHDLGDATEKSPVTVVLLTDGGEDTMPRQDPLAAAKEFGRVPNVTLHIVGFDITREDWRGQLAEMARLSRGTYWPVARASELTRDLRAAVLGTPSGYGVLDGQRREIARGAFGDSRALPEGKYVLTTDFVGTTFEEEFWINTDAVTSVCFDAGAAAKTAGVGAPAGPVTLPPPAETVKRPGPQTPAATPAGKAPETQPAAKFCTQCGKALAPGSRFCTKCGAKVPEK